MNKIIDFAKFEIEKMAVQAVIKSIKLNKFKLDYNPKSSGKAEFLINLILFNKILKFIKINKSDKKIKEKVKFEIERYFKKVFVYIKFNEININNEIYKSCKLIK